MSFPRGTVCARSDGAVPVETRVASPPTPTSPESQWFWDHYDAAATQVVEAFQSVGVSLSGATVADVGSGDGFMDLGVFHKARPSRLVGYDLNLTNTEYLCRRAGEEGVDESDMNGLAFERSLATHIPAADDSFDYAFSWSAFEPRVSAPE